MHFSNTRSLWFPCKMFTETFPTSGNKTNCKLVSAYAENWKATIIHWKSQQYQQFPITASHSQEVIRQIRNLYIRAHHSAIGSFSLHNIKALMQHTLQTASITLRLPSMMHFEKQNKNASLSSCHSTIGNEAVPERASCHSTQAGSGYIGMHTTHTVVHSPAPTRGCSSSHTWK